MKYFFALSFILTTLQFATAQVRYSPAYFGPNANPVPEFTDARIPAETTIHLMGDYYFGFGDQTINAYVKVEIPLLPERVSFKFWASALEHYKTTAAVSKERGMLNGNTSGAPNGDLYIQTRISLLKEKTYSPAIILNTTLKTASGTNFNERRYFDTPGYYMDLEFGKSFYTKSPFINEIRAVANIGFLCWETTASTQNDAPMYGIKLICGNKNWNIENTLAGYRGWMNIKDPGYGDIPLVFSSKLTIQSDKINYFGQYQYGINDFPYQQVRLGTSFILSKLTPNYK